MNGWCNKLKETLENTFSMPFEVSLSIVDGEEHFICIPKNEGDLFFTVLVYLHNQIRLIVKIEPQKYGRNMLNEMALADENKKNNFYEYLSLLKDVGAKVQFNVNELPLEQYPNWPVIWQSFSCKITKVPIETSNQQDTFYLISEWLQHGVSLMLSLLTVNEMDTNIDMDVIAGEGTKYMVLSTRYERNPINRRICLLKKGYTCAVCGTNLFEKYGEIGRNYIQVHHRTPVSMMGEGYILDIDRDLIPLCPNCHTMIHRKYPPYSIDELEGFWEEQNYGFSTMAAEPLPKLNNQSNVIVGIVKKDSIDCFKQGKAKVYYFGKKFPSKYNIKTIDYFAPYYEGGIRGYYDVIAVRTANKSEIVTNNESQDEDIRIVLDLGNYHFISDTPLKMKLAYYNYAFLSLQSLLENN